MASCPTGLLSPRKERVYFLRVRMTSELSHADTQGPTQEGPLVSFRTPVREFGGDPHSFLTCVFKQRYSKIFFFWCTMEALRPEQCGTLDRLQGALWPRRGDGG